MTKTDNFRGESDDFFKLYHAAMCVKSVARDYEARNSLVMWALVGDDKFALNLLTSAPSNNAKKSLNPYIDNQTQSR